jgi:hypothetical protein
MEGLTKE